MKSKKVIQKAACLGVLVVLLAMFANSCNRLSRALAEGPGYDYIEQTENRDVIRITEDIGSQYGICPELLQAIIFYESSNRPEVRNKTGDIGYMQVNTRWHWERMEKLGVSDLTDGYGNILVGTDYLAELAQLYGDPVRTLMEYNGDSRAEEYTEAGKMSCYARKILKLSDKLERLHGK